MRPAGCSRGRVVDPGAQWVLAEGADSAAMTRSVPMSKALEDAKKATDELAKIEESRARVIAEADARPAIR